MMIPSGGAVGPGVWVGGAVGSVLAKTPVDNKDRWIELQQAAKRRYVRGITFLDT